MVMEIVKDIAKIIIGLFWFIGCFIAIYNSILKHFDYKVWIIVVALLVIIFVLCWLFSSCKKDFSKQIDKYMHEITELEKENKEISYKLIHISTTYEKEKQSQENKYISEISKLNAIISEKEHTISEKDCTIKQFSSNLTAFPYMSKLIADFETIELEKMAVSLDWGNNKQRQKKVADIRTLRKETKELIEKYKTASYQLEYLKTLYPVIEEVIDTDFSELNLSENKFQDINEEYDVVRNFLSNEEYELLSTSERNQLALDNYVKSHRKTKWQIGRDYEMYVGYKYHLKGYDVSYHGIEKGMEDLGRDLVLTKNGQTLIVQCKYWSNEKVIREKHILQLYGTYVCYCIENNISPDKARCIFVTNITLSEQAKQFSSYLNVGIAENFPLGEYPRIKCNIGKDENGKPIKIYHLPFDQQYDSTKIDEPGEFYAMTVEEAESKGFRRAFKHHYS